MKIEVNGEQLELRDGIAVTELLSECKVKMPDMVAVELNGAILERQAFASTMLKENDKVEFLYFMGGGLLIFFVREDRANRGTVRGKHSELV